MEGSKKRRHADDDTIYTTAPRPTKKIRFDPMLYSSPFTSRPGLSFGDGNRILQLRCRSDELKWRPLSNYLQCIQKEINEEDRSKLVDFIICAGYVANVCNETVHAAVRIADRYLSVKSLKKRKIPIFGLACLIIASKIYDVDGEVAVAGELAKQVQEVEEYAETEAADIVHFETKIVVALNCDVIAFPTTFTFIRYTLSIAEPKSRLEYWKLKYLVEYLAELTLLDYRFLRYNVSLIAASIIYYAWLILNPNDNDPWDQSLRDLTGYSLIHMIDCVKDVHRLHGNTELRGFCNTVDKKYTIPETKYVATLSPLEHLPFPLKSPNESSKGNKRISI